MSTSSPRCSRPWVPTREVVNADSSCPRAGGAGLATLTAPASAAVLPLQGPRYLKSPRPLQRCCGVQEGNGVSSGSGCTCLPGRPPQTATVHGPEAATADFLPALGLEVLVKVPAGCFWGEPPLGWPTPHFSLHPHRACPRGWCLSDKDEVPPDYSPTPGDLG